MPRRPAAIILLAAPLILTLGCEDKKPAPPTSKTPAPTTPAAPTSAGGLSVPGLPSDATKAVTTMANDAKAKVAAGLQSGLDAVKPQIDTFASRLTSAPADKKPAMTTALGDVQSKFTAVSKQIADLRADYNASNWQKLADDAKSGLESLKTSVSNLLSQYK
jgi:hypothetical protein